MTCFDLCCDPGVLEIAKQHDEYMDNQAAERDALAEAIYVAMNDGATDWAYEKDRCPDYYKAADAALARLRVVGRDASLNEAAWEVARNFHGLPI